MPFDDGAQFRSDPDVLLTYQVIARVVGSATLRGERITVRVQNRVVILLGVVRTAAARAEAVERARSTAGVVDVCDRLTGPAAPDLFDEMVADLRPAPEPAAESSWTVLVAVAAPLVTLLLVLAVL